MHGCVARLALSTTTLALSLLWTAASAAQGAPAISSARFEVASVKRSPDPRTVPVMVPDPGTLHPGGRWVAAFVSLRSLMALAYPGHDFAGQIVGGPNWLAADLYHIEARPTSGATAEDVPAMLRALLAERFGLRVKTEVREVRGYELVRARQDGTLGPALRAPEVDCDQYRAARARGEPTPANLIRYSDRLPCTAALVPEFSIGKPTGLRLTAGGVKMGDILVLIGSQVGRPIVDRTGLTDVYDVEVKFAPSTTVATPSKAGPADSYPAILDALQQQAGLKLNDARLNVEVLIIESATPPTVN